MLEFQTVGSIMSTILMQEPQPKNVLLVEGADDDAAIGGHLAEATLGITCGSRSNVIHGVKTAQASGWTHVLGLVDRDLQPETEPDIVLPAEVAVTGFYDLTADIASACPGSIGRAVTAHAHRESRVVARQRGEDIDAAVVDLATRFAGVRIAVMRAGHPVRLGGFDFRQVLDHRFRTVDASGFIAALRVQDPSFRFSEHQQMEIRELIEASAGERSLAGGHDLAGAAFGLVTKAGARQVSKPTIERTIRAFADCAVLATLACIQKLQEMARSRTSYPMFDCFPAATA